MVKALRAAHPGEERYTPQYTVPNTGQGTMSSDEHISQLPPIDGTPRENLSPQMRALEKSGRLLPASHPHQGTNLAPLVTPEASHERMFPLADLMTAWKPLPNVSQWVLHTVEGGYRIQLGSHPPRFNSVILTLVSQEQVLVLEQEVETLLRKKSIDLHLLSSVIK